MATNPLPYPWVSQWCDDAGLHDLRLRRNIRHAVFLLDNEFMRLVDAKREQEARQARRPKT